ncbi:UDP-N-acetylmuramoyl-tripeptide--D-alanyl-D-alanine ligase [Oculatella sp. LEGE 06141]|uniref:UDP-N-acetylmuramoyl-tripeptide--D-alanyl-D- alanine ligase n=1 Tax=Oculatella sp. LEGE 06141 TaxID=1828648 RepID=UPI001882B89A|nr:UDP-N-acetylmuramoyl-tripeptide--D-alanyl-D-alanine ligase [Oculatella sp. LEGE 06141]MBE9182210.1 UDP-N-acetylmuramoyl-tripeptide--D-alanyl-D-alanine ligase [Oculatella sp. LEGE 06141]
MVCSVTPGQLAEILSATLINVSDAVLATIATGITTDSRTILPGEIFVALRGDRFDGHGFVETAIRQGALVAIVDRASASTLHHLPLLQVDDTLAAYQSIARWWRQQFQIPVVAVTGSVGKTTTKELIAAVLGRQGSVLKSQANYNNEIGVPKTLLELEATHRYAVVEMGMRAAGEIALLTHIAHPDVAVITNVGTAHIGRLGSEQAIAAAKCEMLAELNPDGIAVLNYDNQRLMQTAHRIWQGKTITFGLTGGDVKGDLVDSTTLEVNGMTLPLPLPGQHNALNYLAALAVVQALQLPWWPLAQGLCVELPQGRARRYELPHDIIVLDETYNAGLESMLAALHLLAQTPGNRRIAVLGTMKELGERSPEFHHQVGTVVRDLNLDTLLILADEAESVAMAAGAQPTATEQFTSHEAVLQRLQDIVQEGDRLLFKASRAVGLDKVVEQFRQNVSSPTWRG